MRDNTSFRERFKRWKMGEQVYQDGRPIPALDQLPETQVELPQYSGGKDGRKVIKWSYNDETGLVRKALPDIVVTGRRKNVERSYMHPWKTMEEVRRDAYEDYQLKRRQTQANLGMSDAQYNLYEKDLSKPLSPVDPVGEFVVSTAALDPAFKYLFSGTGEVLKDAVYKAVGKVKPLRNTLISREMDKSLQSIKLEDSSLKPVVRTKVGDIEIDNPQLFYRQGPSEMGDDFIETGTVNPGTEFDNPMFKRGGLWYGLKDAHKSPKLTPTKVGRFNLSKSRVDKPKPDLIVSNADMQPSNAHAHRIPDIINKQLSHPFMQKDYETFPELRQLMAEYDAAYYSGDIPNVSHVTRVNGELNRVVPREYGGANVNNSVLYRYNPEYGYVRFGQNPSTINWRDAVSQRPQAALDFSYPSGRNQFEEMWYGPILGKSKAQLVQESTPVGFDTDDMAAALVDQNMKGRVGKYLDQIVDKPTPQEVIDIFNNSVLPRLQFMRPGYRGGLMYPTVKSKVDHTLSRGYTVYPKELFEKARGNDTTVGLHYPETGHIGIKEGYEDFAGGHEFRHRLDKFLMKTDTESDILEAAYDNDFLKLSSLYDDLKDVRMGPEAVTTNFDARNAAIGKYHAANTDWELQNKIIDKLSDEKIIEAVEKSNGYGRAYIDYLRKNNKLTPTKIHQFREAMKWVGMFAGAAPILDPPKQK